MVGLDNAGKTTILYQFLMNEVVHTSPTIGSNVEEVVWKNIHFLVWDLAGMTRYNFIIKSIYITIFVWCFRSPGKLSRDPIFVGQPSLYPLVQIFNRNNIPLFFFIIINLGQQSLRTAWSTYYTNTEVSKLLSKYGKFLISKFNHPGFGLFLILKYFLLVK